MEIAKPIFYIVASFTLFGLLGGLEPNISFTEVLVKIALVAIILGGLEVLKEAKTKFFELIS